MSGLHASPLAGGVKAFNVLGSGFHPTVLPIRHVPPHTVTLQKEPFLAPDSLNLTRTT